VVHGGILGRRVVTTGVFPGKVSLVRDRLHLGLLVVLAGPLVDVNGTTSGADPRRGSVEATG